MALWLQLFTVTAHCHLLSLAAVEQGLAAAAKCTDVAACRPCADKPGCAWASCKGAVATCTSNTSTRGELIPPSANANGHGHIVTLMTQCCSLTRACVCLKNKHNCGY